ncbi:MAG: nucleotidyltransferase family protein [Clostridia bacterium]|nr:nucleotidyltransferase family protein [Clostridia bacterium]
MNAAGIIAEYDPFHNGHAYHIEETKRRTGCDCIIAVMNGSFSQRGEPMLLDKFTRAHMAVAGGCDIVVELPACFGPRPAEIFASGGVKLLDAMNCVEYISFGCETEDVRLLDQAVDLLTEEPADFRQIMSEGLGRGESFARARGNALIACLGADGKKLLEPNASLAIEYMRALRCIRSPIKSIVIGRTVPHNSGEIGIYSSASAVREAVYSHDMHAVRTAVPYKVYELLTENEGAIAEPASLDTAVLYALRRMDANDLRALPDVTEGLENRLFKASCRYGTRQEILMACKCKRYSYTRLSRILIHALLGNTQESLDQLREPSYIRVLSVKKGSEKYLAELQRHAELPVITNPVGITEMPGLELDIRSADIRAVLSKKAGYRISGSDYANHLVYQP